MSKAAMFPIAKPYPEWTSGRPIDLCNINKVTITWNLRRRSTYMKSVPPTAILLYYSIESWLVEWTCKPYYMTWNMIIIIICGIYLLVLCNNRCSIIKAKKILQIAMQHFDLYSLIVFIIPTTLVTVNCYLYMAETCNISLMGLIMYTFYLALSIYLADHPSSQGCKNKNNKQKLSNKSHAHINDSRQSRHIADLLHSRQKSTNTCWHKKIESDIRRVWSCFY